ncbi:MAG TPA: NYN domain-containing protein [Ktedonobacterales bacterium]|nr:NYN domain-containing protein [Ktedonobacterales bacterium]
MNDELALFIDFENIRYSMINVQHREPDPQELIGIARRFGTIMVARAYADWTRQPEFFKGSLMAAMIDRVDCPAKVRERFRQNNGTAYNPQASYYDRRDTHPADGEGYSVDDGEEPNQQPIDIYRSEAPEIGADAEIGAGYSDVDSARTDEVELRDQADDGESDLENDDLDDGDQQGQLDSGYSFNGFSNNNSTTYYPPQQQQQIITQSTVDLNMLMDMIETVFDRPSIGTFILMSGDRDFTRICARLKLRLNKRVVVVGVPGTVSRDLIAAADQFLPLGVPGASFSPQTSNHRGIAPHTPGFGSTFTMPSGPVMPDEPGFIQFLDYIDRHWSWRTVHGVANFIGDPYNPKNRFRGRLTKDSARDLLQVCVEDGILMQTTDSINGENLRLNRDHPVVVSALGDTVGR